MPLPARVRGRLVIEGGGALPPTVYSEVALRPPWTRVPCLSDTIHKADPEPYSVVVGQDGTFEFTEAIGERTLAVDGLPPGWTVTEVRRRGRALPEGRLMLRPGELVKDIEILNAAAR